MDVDSNPLSFNEMRKQLNFIERKKRIKSKELNHLESQPNNFSANEKKILKWIKRILNK